jgi:hypothetical protein
VSGVRVELGTTHIPREEARFIPGAFADPFHVVEALPGLAPVLSGLPYYLVRGAPPGDVGYSIDGVPVPLLFHVGPGPSVIATPLVGNVDLYSSGYPAMYGGYAGGIIAGTSLEPSSRPHAEAQARVFDASAFVETPFHDGAGAASVSGRYSYTQALIGLVAPDYGLGYWDYQARVSHRLGEYDRLTLFVFGARDELDTGPSHLKFYESQFHRADLR